MAQLQDFPSCETFVAQLDWRCGPVGQTRDSDALERSNFDHVCDALMSTSPDFTDFEIIRWSHWACGWVEEVFTRPGSACEELAVELRAVLDEYACLDEERLARYEQEDAENV